MFLTAALDGVELSGSHLCHFMPLYPLAPQESATSAKLNGRLGGSQSHSGHCGEEKTFASSIL